MQPVELWVVHYRLGPGVEGGWATRAFDAEDAMERFLESAGEFHCEGDVVAVRRRAELDS